MSNVHAWNKRNNYFHIITLKRRTWSHIKENIFHKDSLLVWNDVIPGFLFIPPPRLILGVVFGLDFAFYKLNKNYRDFVYFKLHDRFKTWDWEVFFLKRLNRKPKRCHVFKITSIYKFGLSVCLYPINFKTAEPIGPKFFVGHHVTTGKIYEW